MQDVFVSRPTWVAAEFSAGLGNFLRLLETVGVRPRTLGATDYPSKSPLDEVISLMRACRGAIVLGYPQITIEHGKCRENDCSGLRLPTEWNHIEAALAYSLELPLLIIHHQGIKRGVFDRGAVSAFLWEIDLRASDWPMQPAAHGALLKWKGDCLAAPVLREDGGRAIDGRRACPNCSSVGRPFYLKPIGKPFQAAAGGEWECSRCRYVE
jgi:hypothetical protein